MRISARLTPTILVTLTSGLLLSACLTSGPATRFYSLIPVAGTSTVRLSGKPVTLVVKDVRLPLYLDRPQIVTRSEGSRLQFSEFEQWGGNLRDEMTRLMAENLGKQLEGARVITAPHLLSVPPDYRLEVDVLGFEHVSTGLVRLSARWTLMRGQDASILSSSEVILTSQPLGSAPAYETLVSAMSATYGELARAIANDVLSQRPGGT